MAGALEALLTTLSEEGIILQDVLEPMVRLKRVGGAGGAGRLSPEEYLEKSGDVSAAVASALLGRGGAETREAVLRRVAVELLGDDKASLLEEGALNESMFAGAVVDLMCSEVVRSGARVVYSISKWLARRADELFDCTSGPAQEVKGVYAALPVTWTFRVNEDKGETTEEACIRGGRVLQRMLKALDPDNLI